MLDFSKFTNLYALSKTLRFELKPYGKTLENMKANLGFDPSLQTFLKDQNIEDAYQTLKPVLDKLHEDFISMSCEVTKFEFIDLEEYAQYYQLKDSTKLDSISKKLREYFNLSFQNIGNIWKDSVGLDEKGKDFFKKNGAQILCEEAILQYIKNNVAKFHHIHSEQKILDAIQAFKGFYTYFSGFNQNRENYYETANEKATAVATRIIHDNLPKFCDTIFCYLQEKDRYESMYDFLKGKNISLETKEKIPLEPLDPSLFELSFFNQCLSQTQIEHYNAKISNLNSLINLYNQQHSKEKDFKKLKLFKTLFKQIGCGTKQTFFEAITCDFEKDILEENNQNSLSLEKHLQNMQEKIDIYFGNNTSQEGIQTVFDFIKYLQEIHDYQGLFITKKAMNTISNKYFINWYQLSEMLAQGKKSGFKMENGEIHTPEVIDLAEVFYLIDQKAVDWKLEGVFFKSSLFQDDQKKKIIVDADLPSQVLLQCMMCDLEMLANKIVKDFPQLQEKIAQVHNEDVKIEIKQVFDDLLSVFQIMKYFQVKESKIKSAFTVNPVIAEGLKHVLMNNDVDWFHGYDLVRNYLTKKPQDQVKENKLKLNFENSTLANGWDINKETENYCILVKNPEGKIFLAIMNKKQNFLFQKEFSRGTGKKKVIEKNPLYILDVNEVWQKIEYKLLPGPNKMLPKCLLVKSDITKYGATPEIITIYKNGSFKKSEANFSQNDAWKMIDFYKSAILKYEDWKCFHFQFKATQDYQDIGEFYADVEKQGYKLNSIDINKKYLLDLVEEGKIYLFEVKNQDSNANKTSLHRDNLHTMYWRAIFENIQNKPKLNGEAEIFYRKALSEDVLKKKQDKAGKEIIENYRFSQEKFLFHVPITLNFSMKENKMNQICNDILRQSEDIFILGIDRGEKHLAYYSLINSKGEIVEQGSFNTINNQDYHAKLDQMEGDRQKARQNWQTIGKIKDMKDGYISQVIKKIADLAIQYNAFIVLEDLNTGFKRGRQKIEKQVYQKLELALAKKLNFYVDKSKALGEPGSVTQALQLTPPVSNYGDIEGKKQVGIMLYTRANYTSQTDPATGWRKSIYLKTGSEKNIEEQITKLFSDISFDGKDYVFEYTQAIFEGKEKKKQIGEKKWKLYSSKDGKSLDRYRGKKTKEKNQWEIEQINIVALLDELFSDFDKTRSLLDQIKDEKTPLKKCDEHTAWESLRFAIDLIQQIRNTGDETKDNDFLQSPVRDENGNHFDTRDSGSHMPDSGDANGAYNIARKGMMMIEKIKHNPQKPALFISDADWDIWLQDPIAWKEKLNKEKSASK